MNLVLILAASLLSFGSCFGASEIISALSSTRALPYEVLYPRDQSASSNAQTPALSQTSSQTQASPAHQTPSTVPHHTTAKHKHHARKSNAAPCSDSAAPSSPPAGKPPSSTPAASNSPCPPAKKIIRNGGAAEPAVQLVGGTSGEQASSQRSTEELSTATQENLKKIEGLPLNPNQQDMVTQIKEFMEQSKAAAAAGDEDRAHDFALKAHLLSEELIKP